MVRFHADLTEAATAQVLGIAVGTVKSYTSRWFDDSWHQGFNGPNGSTLTVTARPKATNANWPATVVYLLHPANGGVVSWLPLFLFVVLFGPSMDYHIFVVSRIREGIQQGLSNKDSVAHGIVRSAGMVTSAALVMVGVFSVFGSLSTPEMKQLGAGLATPSSSARP